MSDRRDRNWELHDGAQDGYEDAHMNFSSESEANNPLAKFLSGNRTTPIPIAQRRQSSHMKIINFKKNTNRKNGDPYFNPVKEAIVGSRYYTVTLKNGHILRKLDLAIKGKILPGLSKILVNQKPRSTDSINIPSLAGKRKMSPTKKKIRANSQKRTPSGT